MSIINHWKANFLQDKIQIMKRIKNQDYLIIAPLLRV